MYHGFPSLSMPPLARSSQRSPALHPPIRPAHIDGLAFRMIHLSHGYYSHHTDHPQRRFEDEAISTVLGSSRNAVAKATGVNATHIGRIFRGTRTPSLELAAKIAHFLGLSLDDFYIAIREIRLNPDLARIPA